VILLHRFTPFAIALASCVLFLTLSVAPFTLYPIAIVAGILIPLLFARLLLFEVKRPAFYVFLGTPFLLLLSSLMFFLLLESVEAKWVLGGIVTVALFLYAENLFAFYHLPSTYQAYSLEYLTLMMYIGSAFFFTSSAYMGQLFLELPLWVPAILVFASILYAMLAVFWVSKIGFETGIPYAVLGAILMTELYVSLAFLPVSFITNAAAFSVCLSTYFGLTRAHVLEKLTPTVTKRYLAFGLLLLAVIFGTATWI
jgi:hypothetical protein